MLHPLVQYTTAVLHPLGCEDPNLSCSNKKCPTLCLLISEYVEIISAELHKGVADHRVTPSVVKSISSVLHPLGCVNQAYSKIIMN